MRAFRPGSCQGDAILTRRFQPMARYCNVLRCARGCKLTRMHMGRPLADIPQRWRLEGPQHALVVGNEY